MNKFFIILLLNGIVFGQQINRKLVWEQNFDSKVLNLELGCDSSNCCCCNNESQLYIDQKHNLETENSLIIAENNSNNNVLTRIDAKRKKDI